MDDEFNRKSVPTRIQRGVVRSRGARGGHANPPSGNSVVRHSNRGRTSSSADAHSRTSLPHIGYKMLCDMLKKEPDEMIVDMTKEYFQLDKFLSDERIEKNIEWLEMLTTLFERMLGCLGQERRIADVLIKLPKSFYFETLHEQLRSKDPKTGTFRFKLIHQTLKILDQLLTISPHSEDEVSPFIERIGTCLSRTQHSDDDEIKLIRQLHGKLAERAESIYQRNEEEKVVEKQKPNIDRRPPPNDFRLLNLIPSMTEILSTEPVFLRRNIVEQGGSYENAQHYLDVHFRLLREDFLGPLRDGIQAYIHKTSTKNTDIRIYENVYSLGPKLSPKNGLVYGLKLDEKKFGKIPWANSRRLIYGSLLALTSNQFQTCLFVTVEDRSDLEKKLTLYVRPYLQTADTFVNRDSVKLQLLNEQQYLTMVETTSYFEAYRHILHALQKIPDNQFPLSPYILHLSSNITPPDYVKATTQFDFTPLFAPLKAKIRTTTQLYVTPNSTDLISQRPQISISYEVTSAMKKQYRNVTLLNTHEWPKPNEVPLNEKQYEALKLALTKKVALIQGPPGTGKTYLGVKIAELLLHNRSVWCSNTEENSPILMVCQTNHALDQFLEHIITRLKMNDGLIRVGGRCQNETIQPFSLTKARQNYREKHLIPSIIHKQKREIMNRKTVSQLTIQSNEALIDASYLYLTSLSRFNEKKVIKSEHYHSLTIQQGFNRSQEKILADWLGLNDNVEFIESIENDFEEMSINDNQLTSEDEEDEEEKRRRDEIDSDEEFYQPAKNSKVKHSSIVNQVDDEWQTVVNKGKQKQITHELLTRPTRLTDVAVDKLETNLWTLSYEKRRELYRYWLKKYRDTNYQSVSDAQFEFNRTMAEHLDYLKLEDFYILKNAIIVAMTTTCAAKYFDVLQKLSCKIVIVEEAAELFEAHVITSLSPKCEHLILIGDHIQLRPSPSVYKLAQQYHMDVSLFERLIKNNFSNVRLNIQHRMRPELCQLMVHFYDDLKNHESVYTERPAVIGVRQNLYFINHNHPEELFAEGNSKQNRFEAEYILALAHFLVKQGYSTSKITILVMYLGQRALISRLLKTSPLQKLLKGIRINVTDSFQGEENDIILLSLVRSNNPEGKIGFLKVHNRICVALSRARCAMFIVGNLKFLKDNEDKWEKIGKTLIDGNAVGTGLPLCCNQHPEDIFMASTAASFSERPEGGCKKLCGQRLRCGHSCPKLCHNYDHERVRCTKPCDDVLYPCGHRCRTVCHMDEPNNHGICKEPVQKKVPTCQHTIDIACGIEPTSDKCTQMVTVRLPCDHLGTTTCAIRTQGLINTVPCSQPCGQNLLCKHKCSGKCGECKGGQLHLPCKEKSSRQFLCTHSYETVCSNNYSLCSFPCETSCSHSKCSSTCSEPCSPCKELCDNKCMHSQCSKLCSEICDREPCRFPCSKNNPKCDHPCIGVCGEPCPVQCRICNKQIVEDYFFGNEDKAQARFVHLPDCGHLFEIDGLDRYINETIAKQKNNSQSIQYISCPRCQTKIRHCQRYKSQINSIQLWIEQIKTQQQNGVKSSDLILERNQSIEQLKNLSKSTRSIEQKPFDGLIHRFDKKKKSINIDELNYLKNTCTFFKEIDRLLTNGQSRIQDDSVLPSFEHLIAYLLKQSNDKLTRNYTEQQLFDIQNELKRLRCLLNYFLLNAKSAYIQQISFNNYLNELKILVTKSGVFTQDNYQSFQRILTTINETKYLSSLNLLDEQSLSVINTLKMESGQWYVCPKNHVYNIKIEFYHGKCPICVPIRNINSFSNNFN